MCYAKAFRISSSIQRVVLRVSKTGRRQKRKVVFLSQKFSVAVIQTWQPKSKAPKLRLLQKPQKRPLPEKDPQQRAKR
jgi:hypothetical protein